MCVCARARECVLDGYSEGCQPEEIRHEILFLVVCLNIKCVHLMKIKQVLGTVLVFITAYLKSVP